MAVQGAPVVAERADGPGGALRLEFLDGIRALAAGYVVLHHIWLTVYPGYPDDHGPWYLNWLGYGQVAVAVFIVVSGFSLSIGPQRAGWRLNRGVRDFLRRRAWRILPTYWAALILSCLVFGAVTPAETGGMVSWKAFAVHAVLLQDVVDSPKPNGAFWSIAIEFQIYFTFPLVLWLRRRVSAAVLALIGTVAVVAVYLLAVSVPAVSPVLHLTPAFLALFVMGVAAAEGLRRGALPRRPLYAVAAAGLVAFLVLVQSRSLAWVDEQYFWVDLIAGAGVAAALALMADGRIRGAAGLFEARPTAFVGRFSYSMYCVHVPLIWLTWHFVVADLDLGALRRFALLLALAVPVVLVCSYLFHLVAERPFLERRSFAGLLAPLRRPSGRRAAVGG